MMRSGVRFLTQSLMPKNANWLLSGGPFSCCAPVWGLAASFVACHKRFRSTPNHSLSLSLSVCLALSLSLSFSLSFFHSQPRVDAPSSLSLSLSLALSFSPSLSRSLSLSLSSVHKPCSNSNDPKNLTLTPFPYSAFRVALGGKILGVYMLANRNNTAFRCCACIMSFAAKSPNMLETQSRCRPTLNSPSFSHRSPIKNSFSEAGFSQMLRAPNCKSLLPGHRVNATSKAGRQCLQHSELTH